MLAVVRKKKKKIKKKKKGEFQTGAVANNKKIPHCECHLDWWCFKSLETFWVKGAKLVIIIIIIRLVQPYTMDFFFSVI